MSIVSIPYTFGANNCLGCHKPLNRWNKHVYHNRKCFLLMAKSQDECIDQFFKQFKKDHANGKGK